MNSHKRLTPYLSGIPPMRSHSQQNYLFKANMSFTNRNPQKLQNVSNNHIRYGGQCQNHHYSHHCCCHSQPHQTYFPNPSEQKLNDLREQVRRERFQNKLLLKELQSKEIFRDHNSDLNRKLEQRIDEISKLNKKVDEQRREIEILKDSNNWLKQESLRLAKQVEEADKKISQRDTKIGELQFNQQGDYIDFQKKLLQMQKEVVQYKQILKEIRQTHKIEGEWRRQSTKKIQNKLRSNNEISLCIENQEYYPLSRSTQTYMSGADIDYGFGNVSKMQDKLCEMINQNIVSQDTLFRRIRTIEEDLARGMQILASVQRAENQLQLQAFRMDRQLRETR